MIVPEKSESRITGAGLLRCKDGPAAMTNSVGRIGQKARAKILNALA